MILQTSSAFRFWRSVSLSSVFLIAGAILFALVLTEGILRLFPHLLSVELQQLVQANPDNRGIAHTYIGHLHKPNNTFILAGNDFRAANRTDGYGFRNAWPWPEKAAIVALGDSLTFGYGVEDNQAWPALVAKKLPHNSLINLGLIGAGPQQYLRVYETFGRPLQPKLLLVGLFGANDFWDADLFDRWLSSGTPYNYLVWRDYGRPSGASYIDSLEWKANLLLGRSYVYNLLLEASRLVARRLKSERRTFRLEEGRHLELDIRQFANDTIEARPDGREFQLVLQALQEMQAIAKNEGTKVLVILQPSKEEVYLPLLGEPVSDPSGPLREELGKSGINYLNLTPVFRERAAAGEKLFFEVDGHPNAAGYALIAYAVLNHLKQNAAKYGLSDFAVAVSSGSS